MKKLINSPEFVVDEMLEGFALAYPSLQLLEGHRVILRSDIDAVRGDHVAVISGGGSGHEPAHAGYVGFGMLSACVAGEVFTSPSPASVVAAIHAVTGPSGVLLVVKNYTGDRLNFGLAAEIARDEGFQVEMVVVGDDVALPMLDTTEYAGRRGLAGTVLVHKVAGALAEEGRKLGDVAGATRRMRDLLATMGVALSPCITPAVGEPSFLLGDDEIELGLGIHGEAGIERRLIAGADSLVDQILETLIARMSIEPAERIALLINNLGATPTMELGIVARRAIIGLESAGLDVARVYLGTFLSALDMAGVSLTLLRRLDNQMLMWLDAPTDAPAWPVAVAKPRTKKTAAMPRMALANPRANRSKTGSANSAPLPATSSGLALKRAIERATAALIAKESELTLLDQAVGDGDLGVNLARLSRGLRDRLHELPVDDAAAALREIGLLVEQSVGGTSGPLYAVLFLRAAMSLDKAGGMDLTAWADAIESGIAGISHLGDAQPGDCTMVDALVPVAKALRRSIEVGGSTADALQDAAEAAEAGALATANMRPRRGRSSYLGDRALGTRDPGTQAIAIWLGAVAGRF